LGCSIYN